MKSHLSIAVACILTSTLSAAEMTRPQAGSLGVHITRVDVTDRVFLIDVEVTNLTEQPLRIWDFNSVPGRESLLFLFPDSMGGVVKVFRKENQRDSGGRPRIVTLPPKSGKRWTFNLFDQTWQIPGHVGSGTTALVRVEFSAPATEGAERGEVWAGSVSSSDLRMNKTLAQIWTAQAIPFTSRLTK
jgi:hypothetical protein